MKPEKTNCHILWMIMNQLHLKGIMFSISLNVLSSRSYSALFCLAAKLACFPFCWSKGKTLEFLWANVLEPSKLSECNVLLAILSVLLFKSIWGFSPLRSKKWAANIWLEPELIGAAAREARRNPRHMIQPIADINETWIQTVPRQECSWNSM